MRKGLNSSRDKTHEKKVGGPKVGPNEPKLGQKFLSCHFLKFVLLVFLEIAYNDSL